MGHETAVWKLFGMTCLGHARFRDTKGENPEVIIIENDVSTDISFGTRPTEVRSFRIISERTFDCREVSINVN